MNDDFFQDMSYSSGLFANDSDDDRPIGSRASPRYQNKHSYIERNKEKRGIDKSSFF